MALSNQQMFLAQWRLEKLSPKKLFRAVLQLVSAQPENLCWTDVQMCFMQILCVIYRL